MKTWTERHLFLILCFLMPFALWLAWAWFKYIKKENVLEDTQEL